VARGLAVAALYYVLLTLSISAAEFAKLASS